MSVGAAACPARQRLMPERQKSTQKPAGRQRLAGKFPKSPLDSDTVAGIMIGVSSEKNSNRRYRHADENWRILEAVPC